MKKLLPFIMCVFVLSACGRVEPADVLGAWENKSAVVYFYEDGTYEIKYTGAEAGGLTSENGRYEIRGGKVEFRLRDKYTLDDVGDVKFERLVHTENRREKAAVSEGILVLNGIEYTRKELD